MEYQDKFGRRTFLKGLAGITATATIPIVNISAKGNDNILEKFGLTGTHDENLEIVKSLSPKDFHTLYDKAGFEKLRDAIRVISPNWFPVGHERVENMRRLLPLINEYSNKSDFSSNRVFSHVFVESGGYNNLNGEGGGGVMHLLDVHWENINPLNEEQNIRRGTEFLHRLKKEFKDEDLASLAFNAGENLVGRINDKIEDFFEYKGWDLEVTSENVSFYLERDYVGNLKSAWKKVEKEKLFDYDSGKNFVSYTGPENGIGLKHPGPLSQKKKLFKHYEF